MPHLHLEYTANLTGLAVEKTLLRLNNVLMVSGQFGSEFDIKSRAVKVETFQVGTSLDPRGFVAVKLSLLSGRSPQCWPGDGGWRGGVGCGTGRPGDLPRRTA